MEPASDLILGEHCSYSSCGALDFLPILCPHCASSYCRHHALPPSHHACTNDSGSTVVEGGRFEDKFKDLLPDRARTVLGEREEAEQEKARRREVAQALLAKNFGKRAGEEKGGEKAVKVKKVSPVVELMRLKQRAKQGDPRKSAGEVSMDDRLYVKVVFVEGAGFVERGMRELWLPKITTSGKALDLFGLHFGIENLNNTSSDPLKLISLLQPPTTPEAPPTTIPNSNRLDSVIANGGTVWLLRGALPV